MVPDKIDKGKTVTIGQNHPNITAHPKVNEHEHSKMRQSLGL